MLFSFIDFFIQLSVAGVNSHCQVPQAYEPIPNLKETQEFFGLFEEPESTDEDLLHPGPFFETFMNISADENLSYRNCTKGALFKEGKIDPTAVDKELKRWEQNFNDSIKNLEASQLNDKEIKINNLNTAIKLLPSIRTFRFYLKSKDKSALIICNQEGTLQTIGLFQVTEGKKFTLDLLLSEGAGGGKVFMNTFISACQKSKMDEANLYSEKSALGFYKKFSFTAADPSKPQNLSLSCK